MWTNWMKWLTFSAIIASKIERTLAVESTREINACRRWWAWIFLTIYDVFITVLSLETRGTLARIPFACINASSTVLTKTCLASVVFVLTSDASVVGRASAVEAWSEVLTFTTMHAWASDASLRGCFTLFAVGSTGASVTFCMKII